MNIEIPNNQEIDIEEINQPSSSQNSTLSNFSQQFSIHNLKNFFKRKKSTLDTGNTENENIELKNLLVTKNEQTSENAHQSTSFEVPQASTSVSNNTVQNSKIETQLIDETIINQTENTYLYPNNFFVKRYKFLQWYDKRSFYKSIQIIHYYLVGILFFYTLIQCFIVLRLKCSTLKEYHFIFVIAFINWISCIVHFLFTICFYIATNLNNCGFILSSLIFIFFYSSIVTYSTFYESYQIIECSQ